MAYDVVTIKVGFKELAEKIKEYKDDGYILEAMTNDHGPYTIVFSKEAAA